MEKWNILDRKKAAKALQWEQAQSSQRTRRMLVQLDLNKRREQKEMQLEKEWGQILWDFYIMVWTQ